MAIKNVAPTFETEAYFENRVVIRDAMVQALNASLRAEHIDVLAQALAHQARDHAARRVVLVERVAQLLAHGLELLLEGVAARARGDCGGRRRERGRVWAEGSER